MANAVIHIGTQTLDEIVATCKNAGLEVTFTNVQTGEPCSSDSICDKLINVTDANGTVTINPTYKK